jgi:multidrug efflux pump subunit AcrA (membrane-fusion protein)
VLLTGALHPTRAVDVLVPATDPSTLVIRWLSPNGAAVKAGDRVLELDGTPFTSKLADARHQLALSQAQLRVLEKNNAVQLASRQLALRESEITVDKARLRDGLPEDVMTRRAAETARLQLTQAEAALRSARADLASDTELHALDEKLKRIDLDRTRRASVATEHAISSLVVKAPRDGVVMINAQTSGDGHKFRVGDSVESGMPILSLPDLTRPMEVRASLSDVDDGLVALHMAGRCTLDAYPAQPGECSVEQLAPVARPLPGRDPLRRGFEVTLALAHRDDARLRPGMSVKVELDRPVAHGLVVPRGAVIHGAPAHVQLGSGELREVALGRCDAQRCAVTSGLAEGDVVVIGGPS